MDASVNVRKGAGKDMYMRWNEAIRLVRWVDEDDIGSERDRGVQRVDCTMFARFHMLAMYVTSIAFQS